MVVAKELTKVYGDSTVVNGINLQIDEGDFIGVVGDSGSGKSTLLYLLSGLLEPTKGSITLGDKDIIQVSDKELSNIRANNFGFIFQFHNLIMELTVLENIEIPLILTSKNPRKYQKKIYSLLKEVGLEDYVERSVNELSGGQQQRVAIARALVNDPKIIFADEPTGSLDSENTDSIIKLLGQLNIKHKITIIMVTHSERTLSYCNKVIRVSDGRIIE